jgi:hypothetical protein
VIRSSNQTIDLGLLADRAAAVAEVLASLTGDIAWVIDGRGRILCIAQDSEQPLVAQADAWVGRPWAEAVVHEARRKIDRLWRDASSNGFARRREVGLVDASGGETLLACTALRLGDQGPVVAVGRNLQTLIEVQRRYLEAQQELERGYWNNRLARAREQR